MLLVNSYSAGLQGDWGGGGGGGGGGDGEGGQGVRWGGGDHYR